MANNNEFLAGVDIFFCNLIPLRECNHFCCLKETLNYLKTLSTNTEKCGGVARYRGMAWQCEQYVSFSGAPHYVHTNEVSSLDETPRVKDNIPAEAP